MVVTLPTNNFLFLHQNYLKIHINFSSYRINDILLVFESTQLLLSLKNTGYNKHIAQDIQIANLGANRLVDLN